MLKTTGEHCLDALGLRSDVSLNFLRACGTIPRKEITNNGSHMHNTSLWPAMAPPESSLPVSTCALAFTDHFLAYAGAHVWCTMYIGIPYNVQQDLSHQPPGVLMHNLVSVNLMCVARVVMDCVAFLRSADPASIHSWVSISLCLSLPPSLSLSLSLSVCVCVCVRVRACVVTLM